MKSLIYLVNLRFPTEKAQGVQVAKMSEALAATGLKVALIHPWRQQQSSSLGELLPEDIFRYYSVRPIFQIQTLPNWDIITLEKFFPHFLFVAISFWHAVIWGWYAVRKVKEKADIFYTRDAAIAFWLTFFNQPTIYEIHRIPKKGGWWLLRLMRRRYLRLIITTTEQMRRQLISRLSLPADLVLTLPDGVDLKNFSKLPDQKTCREKLALPIKAKMVGYVGKLLTMGREKGTAGLLQAFVNLKPRFPPLYLLLVGGPARLFPLYQQQGVILIDHVPPTNNK